MLTQPQKMSILTYIDY